MRCLPEMRKFIPPAKVTLALAMGEPPILVHFMPTSMRIDAKKARMIEMMINARHMWMSPVQMNTHDLNESLSRRDPES